MFSIDKFSCHGSGEEFIQQIFTSPFLLEVVLCFLLHQLLQVDSVALHPAEEVVQDVAAAQVLVDSPQLAPDPAELRPVPRQLWPAPHHDGHYVGVVRLIFRVQQGPRLVVDYLAQDFLDKVNSIYLKKVFIF